MITWMQRHKKYLVVTIWISVIAFVGAGTVGWGSVDLNGSRNKYVAVVGNLGITHKEFNDKYNELYIIQSQLSNGELTREQALALGIDKQALYDLMREKLLLNYAQDLGFYASDDEVLKTIASEKIFQKSEKDLSFDKDKYLSYLKALRLSETEFAKQIKEKIEISKMLKLLNIPASKKEIELLSTSVNMEDEINLKIIDLSSKANKIEINNEELHKYWEEHKSDYKSELSYEYSEYFIEPKLDGIKEDDLKNYWENNKFNYKDSENKIKDFKEAFEDVKVDYALSLLEKDAKLDYIKLKNGEIEFQKIITEKPYSPLVLINKELKLNELSKPFIMDKKYYIVKLNKINEPVELSFEVAKEMVEEDFKDFKFKEMLEKVAQDEIKQDKINGKNIGFISKVSKNNTDLTETEFFTFINELFSKNDKRSYVILSDKVLVYEIISQRLTNNVDKKEEVAFANELQNVNFNLMFDDLLKELEKRYQIKNYYKGSEF